MRELLLEILYWVFDMFGEILARGIVRVKNAIKHSLQKKRRAAPSRFRIANAAGDEGIR